MKKSLLSIVLGLATTIAFGQIEQGTKFLGGTFGYSGGGNSQELSGIAGQKDTTVETTYSSFTILPSFGYMFKDNMGAGIRLGIDNRTNKDANDKKITTNITRVGVFGRYYIPVAGDNLFFHTDLGLDFGFGSMKDETQGTTAVEQKISTMEFGLRTGWDYFIGEKWAIELNWGYAGYSSYKYTQDITGGGTSTTTDIGFGLNLDYSTFGIGARWYF
jgi:hypothetical protein